MVRRQTNRPARTNSSVDVLQKYGPQLGEIAQHEINVDMKIVETSDWYHDILENLLARRPEIASRPHTRMLEIACYRHVFSYRFAKERGFVPTLFDISDYDLEAGRQIAMQLDYPVDFDCVAGEFHDLPFADGYFDLAYISAALHHTRQPERVINEAMRTLCDGGHFYCQREPIERMFCFFKFPGNRAQAYTEFERLLAERDMTRIICSPFPGARNAMVFGRIENDRISLDRWYEAFKPFGEIVEEVLYHEGLLTALDKEILMRAESKEDALARFIADRLRAEVDLAASKLTQQDQLLGHCLPSEPEILEMSCRLATSLKQRHPNPKTQLWRQQMARIFGASARFLVRRTRGDGFSNNTKYRRKTETRGGVMLDNAAYGGVRFWQRLFPDLGRVDTKSLGNLFPNDQWVVAVERDNMRVMGSQTERPIITPNLDRPAVVAIRYRVLLDERLPVARVQIRCGDEIISDEIIPQIEDRVVKLICNKHDAVIQFELFDVYGAVVRLPSRIRVNAIQAVPLV